MSSFGILTINVTVSLMSAQIFQLQGYVLPNPISTCA